MILKHVSSTCNTANESVALTVLEHVPTRQPKMIRKRILVTAELVVIHLQKPTIFRHEKYLQALLN